MATTLRVVEDDFLSSEECEELLFIHRSCSAMGYRPGVQSTHLGHLVASNTAALIVPLLEVRERIRDLVEEKSGHHCMVFIEFTGLISWTTGSSIGWHHDSNRPYLTQRHYSAVCYLNDYGIDFTGGLFHFQADEPSTIIPQSGRVAIYSAGEENIHSVDPVLSGERCTLTMWFTLDPTHDEDRSLIPRLIPLDQSERPNPSKPELASSDVTKAGPWCDEAKLPGVGSLGEHVEDAIFVQHRVPLPQEISPTMYRSAVSIAMGNSGDTQGRDGQENLTAESKRDEMTLRGVGSEREETSQDGALSTNGATLRMPVKDVIQAEVGASRASVEDSGGALWQQSSTPGIGQEVQESGGLAAQDLRDEKLRELGLRLRKRESDGFLILEGESGVAHVFTSSLHALQVAAFCEWQGTSLAALADSGGTYHGVPCPHRPKWNNMKRPMKQATSDVCIDQKETAISNEKRARLGTDSETFPCRYSGIHGTQRPRTGCEHDKGTDRLSGAEACKPQVESNSCFGEEREGDFAEASAAMAPYAEDESVVVMKYRGVKDAVAGWECYINQLWKKAAASLSSWQASGFLHGVGRDSTYPYHDSERDMCH